MVILVFRERIERAVNGVAFSRFHLDGNNGKAVVVVDEIIDFSFAAVVVIEKFVAVRYKLTGDCRFVDRAKVDASFVV